MLFLLLPLNQQYILHLIKYIFSVAYFPQLNYYFDQHSQIFLQLQINALPDEPQYFHVLGKLRVHSFFLNKTALEQSAKLIRIAYQEFQSYQDLVNNQSESDDE